MGISMGGYGSLKLALKHPDKFVAVASLSASRNLTADVIDVKNNFLPEFLDILGSAPLHFAASSEELEASVHLDAACLSQNNPIEILETLDEIDLHFFIEIGANDVIKLSVAARWQATKSSSIFLSTKAYPLKEGLSRPLRAMSQKMAMPLILLNFGEPV